MTETNGTHMHHKWIKWHSVKMVNKKNREYSEQFRTENHKEKEYRMPWAVHNCCLKNTVLSYTQVSSPIS
jgi:hypothetical protein